jgi:hypothetical protein
MKRILLITLLSFFNLSLFAQLKQGAAAIGGKSGSVCYSIIQAKDHGYAMAGCTNSYGAGNEDVYVVKLDSNGKLQWAKAIGGQNFDQGWVLIQTHDGGYVVIGRTASFGAGNQDVYVIKLDSAGNLKWTETIGGSNNDNGYSIIETKDKGLAIAGMTNSFSIGSYDVYVIKLDSAGNLQWTRTVGGVGDDEGYSIIQARDGGYVIAGYTTSFGAGDDDVYVIKLDSVGNLQWTKVIGGTNVDLANSIVQATDGGYLIGGSTGSYGLDMDMYVIKLDSLGNLKWTRTIGGPRNEMGLYMATTNDKGYAIIGYTDSYGADSNDIYMVKLDSAGNLKLTRTIGTGATTNIAWGITQTNDKGFAITGWILSTTGSTDACMIKLDSSSNTCLTTINDSGRISSGGKVSSGGTITSKDSGIFGSGGKVNSGGVYTPICGVESVNDIVAPENSVQVYPNPNNGVFTIEEQGISNKEYIEVYNMLGERVYRQPLRQAQGDNHIDLSNNADGVYLYRIITETGELVSEGKVIIQR